LKQIKIKVNGEYQIFNAEKIRTTDADGSIQDWIPKDEASSHLSSENPLIATKNGIYRIKNSPTEPTGIVAVDENGFVEYVTNGDCIRIVATNVDFDTEQLVVTENGEYKPENANGIDDVYVSVPPKTVSLTAKENERWYHVQNHDGYDKVIVDVEPYRPPMYPDKEIYENGTFSAATEGSYGYGSLQVDVKEGQYKTAGWEKIYEQDYPSIGRRFNHNPSVVYRDSIRIIAGDEMMTVYPYSIGYSNLPRNFSYNAGVLEPSAVVYDDKILLFGNSTEVWSYSEPEGWNIYGNAPERVILSVVHDGVLYIAGASKKLYALESGAWVQKTTIPGGPTSRLVSYGGYIINLGGDLGTDVHEYVVTGDMWMHGADLPIPVVSPNAVIHENRLRVLGSEYGSYGQNTVKNYFADQKYTGVYWRHESFLNYQALPIYSDYAIAQSIDGTLLIVGEMPQEGAITKCYIWRAVEEAI
jgi:hypothetical protein